MCSRTASQRRPLIQHVARWDIRVLLGTELCHKDPQTLCGWRKYHAMVTAARVIASLAPCISCPRGKLIQVTCTYDVNIQDLASSGSRDLCAKISRPRARAQARPLLEVGGSLGVGL